MPFRVWANHDLFAPTFKTFFAFLQGRQRRGFSLSNTVASLLSLLIDDEVINILKARLPAEQRADLVMELINPHRPLNTVEKAKLAGVKERAMRARKYAKT